MSDKFNFNMPGGQKNEFKGEGYNSKLKELENLYAKEEQILSRIEDLLAEYEDEEELIPEGLDDLEAECGLIGLRIKELKEELKIDDN